MHKIIVLGAGMVGSCIALDMAENHKVTLTDIDMNVLEKARERNNDLTIRQLDVTDKEALKQVIKEHDLVLNAVPGFLGYETLRTVIEEGVNVVDIAFAPENTLELDELARKRNVTAIVDCGIAPGMDNLLLGYHNEQMKLTDFECLVGGLPKVRKWPFYYKAPFSPIDVIEEYTRPARYVEHGKEVIREPLTDSEFIYFNGVGTLEAFNTDGLRSIIYTMKDIPGMKEKTLRYPGHVEYIKVLKESGFFSNERIEIDGKMISPLDFTVKILLKEWKLEDKEEDITVFRVTLKGVNEDGKKEEVIYNLIDEYNTEKQLTSMARTTGYTATAAANMFLDGLFEEKGVFPPELIGRHKNCFDYIMNYLEERNIHFIKESSRE